MGDDDFAPTVGEKSLSKLYDQATTLLAAGPLVKTVSQLKNVLSAMDLVLGPLSTANVDFQHAKKYINNQNLSYSHGEDDTYLKEYKEIKEKIAQISRDYYPSERYVMEAYEVLHEWLGSLSRLYYRLGMMSNESPRPLGLSKETVTTLTKLGGK